MAGEGSKDESRRVAALEACAVFGTVREAAFDSIVFTVAQLFRVPIASLTLVDLDRAWSKAAVGQLPVNVARLESFSLHVVEARELVVVEDASQDARFSSLPCVATSPHVRFLVGAPLIGPNDQVVGALCAMDLLPRGAPERQQSQLMQLAQEGSELLRLRVRSLDAPA